MRRKDSAIQQQVANLQMKIVQEDRAVESRTTDLLADWEKTKPVTGNLRPEEALQALTIYEGKFGRLKDDREKCAKAKEALELTDTGLLSGSEERVQVRTAGDRGVASHPGSALDQGHLRGLARPAVVSASRGSLLHCRNHRWP